MTHPYFVAKAREWMHRAGARPQDSADLARWAQIASAVGDRTRGVIVAKDGTLLAETRRTTRARVNATYVDQAALARLTGSASPTVVDMAIGQISQAVGQPCALATWSDLCTGAGRHIQVVPDKP